MEEILVNEKEYPDLIQNLPQANLPIDNVIGYLFQGETGQICFFDFDGDTAVAAHSHGDQWGIVIEGSFNLTRDGKTQTFRKGDSYYIPAGIVHSATFDQPCKVVDFFADAGRYQPKTD